MAAFIFGSLALTLITDGLSLFPHENKNTNKKMIRKYFIIPHSELILPTPGVRGGMTLAVPCTPRLEKRFKING
jgi:hypothetical protein